MDQMNTSLSPLLKTENLSVGYNEIAVLERLSLALFPKELVCFMGPNGIGKSSLIKTLVNLLKPVSGSYQYSINEPIEKVVSVVLTDRVQHPQLTVEELVTMGRYPFLDWHMKLSDDDQLKIGASIKQTNIEHLRKRRIAELSDGQMQMVMIARALAQDTRVLLLDEPTAHLDLNNRVEIMNLLKRLTRETNRAILIATHELDLALQTADRVWIAGTDKSIITGIPEDLVLDGSFDEVFLFKGYDLKTGKIAHEEFRNKKLNVEGEGYSLLWTRNALERNGYSIYNRAELSVSVILESNRTRWVFENQTFSKLEDLLTALENHS